MKKKFDYWLHIYIVQVRDFYTSVSAHCNFFNPPCPHVPQDVAVLAKQQASVILEKILGLHDRRSAVLDRYTDTIASFKQSKNSQAFRRTKKSLDDQFKSFSDSIGKCSKDLQGIDADGSAKVCGSEESELKTFRCTCI